MSLYVDDPFRSFCYKFANHMAREIMFETGATMKGKHIVQFANILMLKCKQMTRSDEQINATCNQYANEMMQHYAKRALIKKKERIAANAAAIKEQHDVWMRRRRKVLLLTKRKKKRKKKVSRTL